MNDLPVSRDSHRLRVARTVAGAVRHDLANAAQLVLMAEATLTAVAGIPRDLPEALRAALRKIELQITRLERTHGAGDAPSASVDVAGVFEPAIALYHARPPARALRIHGEFPADPPLPAGHAAASELFEGACAVLDLVEQRAMSVGGAQALFLHTDVRGELLEIGFTGPEMLLAPLTAADSSDPARLLFEETARALSHTGVKLESIKDSRDARTILFAIPLAPAD